MNGAEVKEKADKVLQELERDLNTYQPLAWGMLWDIEAVEKMEKLVSFYQDRKRYWIKLLAGANEVTRGVLLEFMRLADLEIEAAETVLFIIQGGTRQEQSKRRVY
ncbi:MAG: hypothetical protein R6T98_08285 [Desulfatiglandales bacterium]